MPFDVAKLSDKLWLLLSEVVADLVADDVSARDELVRIVNGESTAGRVKLRGRRVVASDDPEDYPEPKGVLRDWSGEINLYAGGVTWVEREANLHRRMKDNPMMKAQGSPEDIDSYYLSKPLALDWTLNRLRYEVGTEWHEVRAERAGLVQRLGAPTDGKDAPQEASKSPRGRPSKYDWLPFLSEVEAQMRDRGDFNPALEAGWRQSDLERHMRAWCKRNWDCLPSEARIRDKVKKGVVRFRANFR